MIGAGPKWGQHENGVSNNSVAGEAVLDFMFWPARKHKLGWYFEAAFDYNFGRGHELSLGVSGGKIHFGGDGPKALAVFLAIFHR
jgi:hypothetical protein